MSSIERATTGAQDGNGSYSSRLRSVSRQPRVKRGAKHKGIQRLEVGSRNLPPPLYGIASAGMAEVASTRSDSLKLNLRRDVRFFASG